jgi:plasmid stabilization system protein ParE
MRRTHVRPASPVGRHWLSSPDELDFVGDVRSSRAPRTGEETSARRTSGARRSALRHARGPGGDALARVDDRGRRPHRAARAGRGPGNPLERGRGADSSHPRPALMRLPVHPEAAAELGAAVTWHERERPGQGSLLMDELARRVEQAARFPRSGAPGPGLRRSVRRAHVHRASPSVRGDHCARQRATRGDRGGPYQPSTRLLPRSPAVSAPSHAGRRLQDTWSPSSASSSSSRKARWRGSVSWPGKLVTASVKTSLPRRRTSFQALTGTSSRMYGWRLVARI